MILLLLFIEFFKIGTFAFGGGTAMLPLIYQAIEPFGVMNSEDFSDMVALSQVTPGPVAVNAATFVGLEFAGMPGAAVATVGICMPCFIMMFFVIKLLEKFRNNPWVEGAFVGIRPITIGLLFTAMVFISAGVLFESSAVLKHPLEMSYYNLTAIAICIASIVAMAVFKMKPILVMLIMAAVGAAICAIV